MPVFFRSGRFLLSRRGTSMPDVPGSAPAPTAPGRLLPVRRDSSCWSARCGQGAQPPPAGDERLLPWPGGADLEDALAGVPDQPGGQVEKPTDGVRLGVLKSVA